MHKHLWTGLNTIYGFGKIHADYGCIVMGVKRKEKLKKFTDEDILKLDERLQRNHFIVARELDKKLYKDTTKLINIHAYRAIRALQGLPNRGQRTRSNARTAKSLKGKWGQSSYSKKQQKIEFKKERKKMREMKFEKQNKQRKEKEKEEKEKEKKERKKKTLFFVKKSVSRKKQYYEISLYD